MLASPRYAYFVGEAADGAIAAFAILRDLEDPHGNLYLKRIAVARPEEGSAARFSASSSTGPSPIRARTGSSSIASPITRARKASTPSSALPATACCGRPTARRTEAAAI